MPGLVAGRPRTDTQAPRPRAVAVGAGLELAAARAVFPNYDIVAHLADTALADAFILDFRPAAVLLGCEDRVRAEALARRHPGVQVLQVPEGGNQPQAAPVTTPTAVSAAGAPSPPGGVPMPQQLVAVWSPKGGVGKTFVATNVGVAMARRSDFGVALLDLDLHSADTGVYLDLLEGPGIVDVLPFLSELRPEHLEKYMLRHHRSGLMVLLGPPRPELADFVRLDQVLKIVELARRRFGCVLVDLPPHAGEEMVYECLEQSTKIILVTTQDAAALRQTRLTLEVMGKLKIDVANSVLLVLNRYHAGGSVSVERIEDFLGQPVAVRIDEDRRAVELSLFEGRPLAESGRNQRLGAALESLATQVCPAGRGQARPSGGVLSSLFRRR